MKTAIVFCVAFAAGALVTSTLHAAAPVKAAAAQKQDCAINVTSDKFTADLNAKTGTYSGNVMVIQCDTKMRADTVPRDLLVRGVAAAIRAEAESRGLHVDPA